MSVLVKDMKMPKGCYECPQLDGEYGGCVVGATGEYDPYCKDCPLVDLKSEISIKDKVIYVPGKNDAEYIKLLKQHIKDCFIQTTISCSGCVHYDQQQTSLVCHDCKRFYKDLYEG